MSNVSSAINLLPKVNEGFSSTLATTISSGAATVPLNSVAGLTDNTTIVLIVEPKNPKEQVVTGKVHIASASIIGCVWTKGTNTVHTAGSTVVDYVTGTHFNLLARHAGVEHDDGGAHTDVHAKTVTTTGAITSAGGLAITGGTVTAPANSIPASALGGTIWKEVGRTTLVTPNLQGLDIPITPKKYLHIIVNAQCIPDGTNINMEQAFTFNNDLGTNYTWTYRTAVGVGGGVVNAGSGWGSLQTSIPLDHTPTNTDLMMGEMLITNNVAGKPKLVQWNGHYTAPNNESPSAALELWGKWTGTAQITSIQYHNYASNAAKFDTGSEVVVFGHD